VVDCDSIGGEDARKFSGRCAPGKHHRSHQVKLNPSLALGIGLAALGRSLEGVMFAFSNCLPPRLPEAVYDAFHLRPSFLRTAAKLRFGLKGRLNLIEVKTGTS